MKKIGIIGGSGFIGSHTTKKFLEEGHAVKVSATNINKEEKYQHLPKSDSRTRIRNSFQPVIKTLRDFSS